MRVFLLTSIILYSCSSKDCGFSFDEFGQESKLEIKSYIHEDTDCGEWGGHSELIVLTKFRDEYRLLFKKDSSDCVRPGLKDKQGIDSVINKKLIIDSRKAELIMNYAKKLNNHKPASNLSSNAQNYYIIKFKNLNKIVEIIIDDPDNSWTLYSGLKEDLLKQ